jgi:hypothetical protein
MPPRSERELMDYIAGDMNGWLGNYVEYARRLTDAPLAFHVAGGLGAMAGAVGSQLFWYGGGHREQWPNLYLLMLAPSGIMRKSTSVDLPTDALVRARPGVILDREFSPEQFIRNLADQPTSVLKEAEFGSLLERMKSSYMQGMKQRLTDLYDCQQAYERALRGADGRGERIKIVRPSLTIVAASTMDWLVESLTETDMRSGFMPRFLFISPKEKEPEPAGGYWADSDTSMVTHLVKALSKMAHMNRTEVSFRRVRRRVVEWTTDAAAVAQTGEADSNLLGLYSRLGHHLAKLCALITVSDAGIEPTYEVSEDAAERAIALLEWILESTARVFEERVIFSKFERLAQEALRRIGGGIDRSKLLKDMRCPAQDLNRLLQTLTERGQITEEAITTAGRPRKIITRVLDAPSLVADAKEVKEAEGSWERSPPNHVVSFARGGSV